MVSFSAKEQPKVYHNVQIEVSGNGYAYYNGNSIRNSQYSATVEDGSSVRLTFTADNNYKLGTVTVNGYNVTSSVSGNSYTVSGITSDTYIVVTFVESQYSSITKDGFTYGVVSWNDKTVRVESAPSGTNIEVPSSFSYNGYSWRVTAVNAYAFRGNTSVVSITIPSSVTSVDDNTFSGCSNLAAIVWNASTPLTNAIIGSGQSDNLLVFVKQSSYAPSRQQNVVVNGSAENVELTDATSGKSNNFYCPQQFTTRSITYQHRYSMTTKVGICQGWETIALPFDVQNISHESKGSIVPFASWSNGNGGKPFWLYEMTASGWRHTSSIKANTPYIISMPNSSEYDENYNLAGTVTFSAENVTVKASDDVSRTTYNNRTFTPCFTSVQSGSNVYALNVSNDFTNSTGGYNPGSHFVSGLRSVRPFEAYMSASGYGAKPYAFAIDLGNATGIESLLRAAEKTYKVYSLQGQLIKAVKAKTAQSAVNGLPQGVYVVDGRKVIVR